MTTHTSVLLTGARPDPAFLFVDGLTAGIEEFKPHRLVRRHREVEGAIRLDSRLAQAPRQTVLSVEREHSHLRNVGTGSPARSVHRQSAIQANKVSNLELGVKGAPIPSRWRTTGDG